MSKAEDLAKELFPLLETDKIGNNPYITYNTEQLAKQEGFIEGYYQAEKDLKLTWEDISIISECLSEVKEEIEVGQHKGCGLKGMYQEVLKRFKDYKK